MGYPHFSNYCDDFHRLVADTGPLVDIHDERGRQDAKWGLQSHPDGTGGELARDLCDAMKAAVDLDARDGGTNWASILTEEILEAFAETDPTTLRTELVQSGAVIAAWIEHIDRRAA